MKSPNDFKNKRSKMQIKKLIKIIGNIVMIAAIIFVIKRIVGMDIKLSDLRNGKVIVSLGICFVFQTMIIIFSCYPWLMFTRVLSGRSIPFSAAMPVYTQSNLYKYIPGNVFQYVGRNQLATEMEISHVDVACATVMDIFFCVLWTAVISVILLGGRIFELFRRYGMVILITAIVGIAVIIAVVLLCRLKFRERFRKIILRYAKAFEKEKRSMLLRGIFYYLFQNAVSAAMYFACLTLIIPNADVKNLTMLTGAYMFAWIIGFVTIGAPGGIGIREGVMIFVCGGSYPDRIVLFVLIMRIACIGADVAAFIIGKIYALKKRNGT